MKSEMEKFFEELSKKLEDEEYYAKFVEEFCYKEMSKEEAMDLLEEMFHYILCNEIDIFDLYDYYNPYTPKEWVLKESIEKYLQAFDMIEEIVTSKKREFKMFELVEWEYPVFLTGSMSIFKCIRLCGQGETVRRIEVIAEGLFFLGDDYGN